MLVLAPTGRDAKIAASILATNQHRFAGLRQPRRNASLLDEAQCLVVAEEALISSDRNRFAPWLENQPAWSDFPIVLLTMRGTEFDKRLAFLDRYLIVLERPFLASSLANSVRSALRARARQLEVKSYIEQKQEVCRPAATADPRTASPGQEHAGQCPGNDGCDCKVQRHCE